MLVNLSTTQLFSFAVVYYVAIWAICVTVITYNPCFIQNIWKTELPKFRSYICTPLYVQYRRVIFNLVQISFVFNKTELREVN